MLNWTKEFDTFCFLDNHEYVSDKGSVECLAAAGVSRVISCKAGDALEKLQQFIDSKSSWLFGHLGYDLKMETEQVNSFHPDHIEFPDLFFFEPQILIKVSGNEMHINASDPDAIFDSIVKTSPEVNGENSVNSIHSRMTKEEYTSTIKKLQQHILRGDCYEINYCQEFYNEDALIDPHAVFYQLCRISPNPFSALYRVKDQWLMCASPERYITKQGGKIFSQPIKGTSGRFQEDIIRDEESRDQLFKSAKDRSENVMVVDLVRNDLARVCREGSVNVDELYAVYSFPQVHQMISTVSGILNEDVSFTDIIRATFPMGSMTGAPKKSVVDLIEKYEQTKRGIFSGAVGYITPEGDFDFNVVIRSIMYNAERKYLSFQVGSGITFYSEAEKEWEECLLKAKAINKVLQVN